MNYLEKIKQFSKISIAQVCRELKIDRSNLLKGKTTSANEKKVYDAIVSKYESIKK